MAPILLEPEQPPSQYTPCGVSVLINCQNLGCTNLVTTVNKNILLHNINKHIITANNTGCNV